MIRTEYPVTVYARFIHDKAEHVIRPAGAMKEAEDHLEAYSSFAFRTVDEAVRPVARNIALAWAKFASGESKAVPDPSKIQIVKCKIHEDGYIESGTIVQVMWANINGPDGGSYEGEFGIDMTRSQIEEHCKNVDIYLGQASGSGDGIVDGYLRCSDDFEKDVGVEQAAPARR